MVIEVPVSSLQLGMYIIRYGDGNSCCARWDRPLRFQWEIDVIVQSGATVAVVDTEQGDAPEEEASEEPPIVDRESFLLADGIYSRTVDYMHEALADIARRKSFNPAPAREHIEAVMDGVSANSQAATSLTLIRRDGYLATHSVNVCILSTAFATFLGLDPVQVRDVSTAALFHDIGKMLIDPTILEKPGKLAWREFNVIRQHPGLGKLLLEGKGLPDKVGQAIVEHHERADGSGYPRAVKNGNICIEARIIALADVFDAMTGERPYKPSVAPDMALRALYRQRAQAFHSEDVERFIKFLGVYPVGSVVRLDNGCRAVVVGVDPVRPLEPTVRLMFDANMRPVEHDIVRTGGNNPRVSANCARTFDKGTLKRMLRL